MKVQEMEDVFKKFGVEAIFTGDMDADYFVDPPREDAVFEVIREDSLLYNAKYITVPCPADNSNEAIEEYIRRQVDDTVDSFDTVLVMRSSNELFTSIYDKRAVVLVPIMGESCIGIIDMEVREQFVEVRCVLMDKETEEYRHSYGMMDLRNGHYFSDSSDKSTLSEWMDRITTRVECYDTPLAPKEADKCMLLPLPEGHTYQGKNFWAHSKFSKAGIRLEDIWIPVDKSWALAYADTLPELVSQEIAMFKSLLQD